MNEEKKIMTLNAVTRRVLQVQAIKNHAQREEAITDLQREVLRAVALGNCRERDMKSLCLVALSLDEPVSKAV